MITSNQNPKIKLVRALLGRTKERREENAFVVEGMRLFEEAINSKWMIRYVLFDGTLNERGMQQVEGLKLWGVDVDEVSAGVMKSISETETPQGVLAVIELTPLPIPENINFILIPDQIRDPGNLGTLLRTAAATGVQAVIIPPETTDVFAPKVIRSGMGAHFKLPIVSMSWDEIDKICRSASLQVLIADMDGLSFWEMDLKRPTALVIGSEADGASEQARKFANQKIGVPMIGDMESLNAGVAGAVLMFEVVRQRSNVLMRKHEN